MEIEIEIPKSVMMVIMPTFDCIIALMLFYMGCLLTKQWGFGSRRELLLMAHRVIIFWGSASFAWHAYDIYRDPIRHGLTFTNFELHFVVVAIALVSSIRMSIAENYRYRKNGDVFTGPYRNGAEPRLTR